MSDSQEISKSLQRRVTQLQDVIDDKQSEIDELNLKHDQIKIAIIQSEAQLKQIKADIEHFNKERKKAEEKMRVSMARAGEMAMVIQMSLADQQLHEEFEEPDDELKRALVLSQEPDDIKRAIELSLNQKQPPRSCGRVSGKEKVVEYKNVKNQNTQCPICIDDFISGSEILLLPCYHNIHIECFKTFKKHEKVIICPICKKELIDL